MMLALFIATALATPVFGVRYVPFGRGDLTWVVDERTTGRAVGEFDGFVNPPLTAYAGAWTRGHVGLFGSLGVARLTTTQWTGSTWRQRHWGVLRPEVDLRWSFGPRAERVPSAWVALRGHGDLPSARDTSNAYDADEQAAADDSARVDRLHLGGFGGGAAFGVDWRAGHGVAIGASYALGLHAGVLRTSESNTTSTWVVSEAALHVQFELPQKDAQAP